MPPPTLILLERTGCWAAALRRELGDAPVRLIETRSFGECWQQLAAAPAALVAWELTAANVQTLVSNLLRLDRDFPAASAIVLAERRLAAADRLLREAGGIHFVTSPRALEPVAQIMRRRTAAPAAAQLASARTSTSVGWVSVLDETSAGLPWADVGDLQFEI